MPRIRDMEAFLYKTEIKIIYFVLILLIVSDCIVFLNTLESGIDVGQGINVGPGKFVKNNKRRAFNKRRA